jgi:hypothetical protein
LDWGGDARDTTGILGVQLTLEDHVGFLSAFEGERLNRHDRTVVLGDELAAKPLGLNARSGGGGGEERPKGGAREAHVEFSGGGNNR